MYYNKMKKREGELLKAWSSALFVIISLSVLSLAWAQDASECRDTKAISGNIVRMDWVGSILVVNTGGDEMTFTLPDGVKVLKSGKEVSVNDMNLNDNVTVHYCDLSFAGLKAVSIADENAPGY